MAYVKNMGEAANRHYCDGKTLHASKRYHFPKMRELAIESIKSRRGSPTFNLLNQASFMQEWDTDMRYAKTASVTSDQAEKWRKNADSALGLLL